MKLKLKEDPREWRKITLLTALALSVVSSVLRWRKILPTNGWIMVLALLGVIALAAALRPRWFRGYYRASARAGFFLSQFVGYIVLAIFFLIVLTPLGLILRLCGKDLLRLKRPTNADTYWSPVRKSRPLDSSF